VKIRAAHNFDAPVEAVETALLDPDFWGQLELPDVDAPTVLSSKADRIEIAMVWAGTLEGLGRRIAGSDHVTWKQTLQLDRVRHTGRLEIASALRVTTTCRATLRFDPIDGGAGTRRTLDGELSVKVPLVGGQAEQRLAPGIRQRIDDEAVALRAWLAR
jgi:hypothetical protein